MGWTEPNIRDVDAKKFIWKNIVLNLGSFIPLSRTMIFNLIAKSSGDIVVTWELQTGIPLSPTPKEMDRPSLLIRL